MNVRRPATNPCGSCPYRRDVPSGVWEADEYAKLPPFDNETASQPVSVFLCHQQDGRLCAGWVGCHDMDHSLALRMAGSLGVMTDDEIAATLDYECQVPLFSSGAEAAAHGLRRVALPDEDAQRVIGKLLRKRGAA